MPLDLKRLSEGAQNFLRTMFPYLAQQNLQKQMLDYQARIWLEKSLKEYEAYGGIQEKLQKQAALNAIFGDISDVLKGGVKEAPFPEVEFVKRGKALGVPMPGIQEPSEEEYEAMLNQVDEVARPLIYARLTMQKPSEEETGRAIQKFGRDAVNTMIGDFAGDVLKRAEQQLRGREVAVAEAEIPIRGYEAETKRIEAGVEAFKLSDQQRKEWISFVEDIEDHLRQEGVKGTSLSESERALFGQGKIMDPLSAENRGKAYTYLGQIRAKLIKNESLTEGEIRFLTTVRSSAQIEQPIEKGGGLVSPETGLTELEMRNKTLQEIASMIKQKTKLSDEDCLRLAKEFMVYIR